MTGCPECAHRNHVGMLGCFDSDCPCRFRGFRMPVVIQVFCTACGRVAGPGHDCFAGWGEGLLQMRVREYGA